MPINVITHSNIRWTNLYISVENRGLVAALNSPFIIISNQGVRICDATKQMNGERLCAPGFFSGNPKHVNLPEGVHVWHVGDQIEWHVDSGNFMIDDVTAVALVANVPEPPNAVQPAPVHLMPSPIDVLTADAEAMPKWLADYTPGDPFPRKNFFASRIVYYPGSETDGHPLRIFGKAHAAHCFVYADYNFSAATVDEQLSNEENTQHPKGYKLLDLLELQENELTPHGWTPHCNVDMNRHNFGDSRPPEGPFARFAVLQRKDSFDDDHGPERLAYIHVGGDGYATFDALFCQEAFNLPYAVLLQDHGFGMNWNRDGFGGEENLLRQLAQGSGKPQPEWLFVAEHTEPWPGYQRASGPDRGGMHWVDRFLYKSQKNIEGDLLQESKIKFLDRYNPERSIDTAITEAINAAVRRIPSYSPNLNNGQKANIRGEWHRFLINLFEKYTEPQAVEMYESDILALKRIINATYLNDLTHPQYNHDPGFRISHAQKSISVFLKHLWCMNMVATPPQCPVDSIILSNAGQRYPNTNWGYVNTIEEHRIKIGYLNAAREDYYNSLAEWEIANFQA